MTVLAFFLAYVLTGAVFLIYLLGAHSVGDRFLDFRTFRWSYRNFKEQFLFSLQTPLKTLFVPLTWLPGLLIVLIYGGRINMDE